ncbi:hypothetical protein FPQ18DRAFT_400545 [Pyronema domesticum]|uniref:Roadblock/LAMTOR2 domain-containing protein n=1 Tax=Pyronema omphalodes (strain CBS 100304) TaxID=1076935 RepID=U4KU58_PYROM|nr:hypothetical protein FPQ18DRAFT_400545 [Pyronema domesticum]CCX04778.1 Similar to hypothetical protein [Tuber melanosporum Mel28]; acc. no. XP_002836219 [Pyronema omphalodes CBS 100304]
MATNASPAISDAELSAILSRLSGKQSVQSLLILARDTGAIIRATGAITRPTSPDHPLAAEYASAVYRYVKASEELVGALENIDGGVMGGVAREKTDGEEDNGERDDMRLLRIRTRRRELVVVPEDPRYVLVVFHDTPSAP